MAISLVSRETSRPSELGTDDGLAEDVREALMVSVAAGAILTQLALGEPARRRAGLPLGAQLADGAGNDRHVLGNRYGPPADPPCRSHDAIRRHGLAVLREEG
jgi:hypothetical protein